MKDLIIAAGAAAFLLFITSPAYDSIRATVHAIGDVL